VYEPGVWRTTVYDEADVLFDLLDRAAAVLRPGGRLVYLYPALRAGHSPDLLPVHPCLALDSDGEEPLTGLLSRRIICMVKVAPHDARRRPEYRAHHDAAAATAGTLGKNVRARLGAAYDGWFREHAEVEAALGAAGSAAAASAAAAADEEGGGASDGADDDDAGARSADAQHWAAVRKAVERDLGLAGRALALHMRRLRRQVTRRARHAASATPAPA
jgi:hypothetical protein